MIGQTVPPFKPSCTHLRASSNSVTPMAIGSRLLQIVVTFAVFPSVTSDWKTSPSGQKCTRPEVKDIPLVVISMDGFAASYLDRHVSPNIEAFASSGVKAEYIYPTYPSRTFVNHYAMATGLWADSHGIVDNNIWDPTISDQLENVGSTTHDAFYRGDPIWSTFKRQTGKKTACLYWLGCTRNISGFMPDFNPPFNADATTMDRINTVLQWLAMPDRPALIMAYVAEPDHSGHFQKTPEEVSAAVTDNDNAVARLMSGIEDLGLLDCVNVVLVSDHGMTLLKKYIYFADSIPVDGLVPVYGVVGRIYTNSTTRTSSSVTTPFECKAGVDYRLYTRETVPVRYHYSATPRVGDFIFDGRPGTSFYTTKADTYYMAGDHGYDPTFPDMRTIFFARGPAIRSGLVLKPFQSIEYFHLFESLLGLKHTVPTNGTLGVAHEMFVEPEHLDKNYVPISPCVHDTILANCSAECDPPQLVRIDFFSSQKQKMQLISMYLSARAYAKAAMTTTATGHVGIQAEGGKARAHGLCALFFYDMQAFIGEDTEVRALTETVDFTSIFSSSWLHCAFDTLDKFCAMPALPALAPGKELSLTTLLLSHGSNYAGLSRARVPLYSSFVKNFLTPLSTLLSSYAARFGRLLVISGTAHDHNHDGLADQNTSSPLPSHIFRIVIACDSWRPDAAGCSDPAATRVLPFVLPHVEKDINCLSPEDLLFAYTARVTDIEQLTGLRFFADPSIVPDNVARRLRAFVAPSLW